MKVARTVLNGESGSNAADLHNKILGHKSIKMTEIYAKIVDKKKLETVNLVNGMFDQIPAIQ